jgi:hypothetical protein
MLWAQLDGVPKVGAGEERTMRVRNVARGVVLATTLAVLAAMLPSTSVAAPSAGRGSGRYLVVAKRAADYRALRAKAVQQGARVLRDIPQLKTMVVRGSGSARNSLAADGRTLGVASDHVARVAVERPQAAPNLAAPGLRSAQRVAAKAPAAAAQAAGIRPDPAFAYRGLLWDYRRIGLPGG